ncbi:MAG: SET domain-containing protein-lysine N-methyltransferase [Waddliaceae bacterium]|jgi:uncharacterized protein|nr:SET domain-containing protein-lysine N-methyltransferase [Waddliaceae bacterium]MBT3578800.1 SET domain-containing protein-lysine N-methyltransferase [Waddliaceae bacterium]MBT4444335.1 SET domain-containing protein-lysine N-methyltransferase [Waddliaceae bacterium]MBT6928214.1 SET domain-containing protein-lysine N-methyltransferase [Waddliaceae bacterium]MBT7264199.1 SET domain-containing protein-lysine N-methyltransferase [Waddliaceae bacterium]
MATAPKTVKIARGNELLQEHSLEDFRRITGVEYIKHIEFHDEKIRKKVMKSYPKFLASGTIAKNAKWQGTMFSEDLRKGAVADICIRWINDAVGFGVYAENDIAAGDYIGEYTGIVRRRSMLSLNINGYCFNYPSKPWKLKSYMIDASRSGNHTRFINHSDTPNIAPSYALYDDIVHIIFTATKTIPMGTQLTLNYGKDYWRKRIKVKI